jgi:hypothetical protein
LGLQAARFPIKWTHVIEKVSRKTEKFEKVLFKRSSTVPPALRALRLMSQLRAMSR